MKKTRYLILYLFVLCFGNIKAQTENDPAKIKWLKGNAITVSSISPDDTNFVDLQPLKKIFQNVNIVMLGEAAHGEGNTTSSKIRMIKFLHEQMDYDVLAFESGFYDMNKAETDIKKGIKVDSAIRSSVFYIWTNQTEFTPMINYVSDCYKTKNKIELCGFDSQLTGAYSGGFAKEVELIFKNITPLSETESKKFYSDFDSVAYAPFTAKNPFKNIKDSLTYFKNLDLYAELSKKIENKQDAEFWRQMFISYKAHSLMCLKDVIRNENLAYVSTNIRDKQMANNLIWLIEHHPGKKIIVWAASNHLSRNLKTLKDVGDTTFYAHYKPMGEYIKDKYGDKAYSLGFTSAQGTTYAKYMMPAPKEIKQARDGSLECLMQLGNFNYGIVDYRGLPKNNFLIQEIYSNPFGNSQKLGVWPNVLDGVFFINEIVPPNFIH